MSKKADLAKGYATGDPAAVKTKTRDVRSFIEGKEAGGSKLRRSGEVDTERIGSIYLPKTLLKAVRQSCLDNRQSLSDFFTEAAGGLLERQKH